MKVKISKESEILGGNEVPEMKDSISQLQSSIINLTDTLQVGRVLELDDKVEVLDYSHKDKLIRNAIVIICCQLGRNPESPGKRRIHLKNFLDWKIVPGACL